jgi:hypothetical protein
MDKYVDPQMQETNVTSATNKFAGTSFETAILRKKFNLKYLKIFKK